MVSKLTDSNVITQIGILVHDIEKTSQAYAQFFGMDVPSWFWTDTIDKAQTEYRGQPSEARAKLAFFDMGAVQLELIQPDEQPSTWREHLNQHGEGVHHIALNIKGMKTTIAGMAAQGMPLLQKGEYTGGRYAYMDTSDALKVIVELLEND
ncbi:4-hydroxyphenylpyruvate dioxygenase-like putative hemolysin [Paenibacillus phyllosphaerae]|uniref:4-hydroxyphenylpyruvate dioxygenase-like putative hemolysin n=1 Tax=Paenibacillus phyllosphaerae TaxID=274593 RepID=A0A7W5B544_9BACL|nr:VOC family protein [Paenibacillus phyllosphaerae]MBB3114533.1 4-hydroxyphenylpyruvate dioxygenase-like putative hemolysin [Paenibacillus phyllosphaerae]